MVRQGRATARGTAESAEHGVLMLMRGINALFAEGDLPRAIAEFDRAAEIGLAATATRTRWRSSERAERSSSLSGRGGSRAPRRGDCLGRVRRAAAVLDRGRLLHHDQLLSGRRRLPSGGGVDGGREPLVRPARGHRLPRRAASIARRCGSEASGPRRRSRRSPRARLYDFDRHITAGGYYEIGEIRRRRGDFAAAMEAYAKADELGRAPQPGLALLRLAEARSTARSRRSRARSRTPRTRFRGCGACRRRSRSRSRRAT